MLENIYAKINDFINNNEIISEKCFIEITELLIEYYRIEKFLDGVSFESNQEIAKYSLKEHRIIINNNYLNELFEENYGILKSQRLGRNYTLIYILLQLVIYFHELKHVIQRKLIYTNQYDCNMMIMSIIFIKCMEMISLEEGKLYQKYGNFFPIERDAEIFGYSMAIDIFCYNETIKDDFYAILLSRYCHILKYGYNEDFTSGIFDYFFEKIRKNKEDDDFLMESIKLLDFKRKLSVGCRLNQFETPWFNDFQDVFTNDNKSILKKKLIL